MAGVRRLWLGILVALAGCGLCSDETMSTDIWVAGERLRVVRRDCGSRTGFVYVGVRPGKSGTVFTEECREFDGMTALGNVLTVRLRGCRREGRREFAAGAARVVVLSDTQK